MRDDEAFLWIVEAERDGLRDIAAGSDAQFIDASDEERGTETPPFCFRLVSRSGGAKVEVFPDGAYSTYVGVGECGWIEVFTSPKYPQRGVDAVLDIVNAVVVGRVKERVWRDEATGAPVDSHLYIKWHPEDGWHLIGRLNRPLFRRYDEELLYPPYRSP